MPCKAERQCCSKHRFAVSALVRLAISEPCGTAMLALSVIETRKFPISAGLQVFSVAARSFLRATSRKTTFIPFHP